MGGGRAKRGGVDPKARPSTVVGKAAGQLHQARSDAAARIRPPSTDCLSPSGVQGRLAGLTRGIRAEFYGVETRRPAVYRGNPFQVEVGLAWGGDLPADDLAKVLRFANRVPLQYLAGSCCITKAVMDVSWRNYGLTQSRGALPSGPLIVLVHLASVWVPFSSESKVAVADYDEIRKEIKLAVQTCGRRLGQYVKRKARARSEARRREVFNLYIEEVVSSVEAITGKDQKLFRDRLLAISRKKTDLAGMLEEQSVAADELESCENVIVVDPDAQPELEPEPEPEPAAEPAVPPIPVEAERLRSSQLELV